MLQSCYGSCPRYWWTPEQSLPLYPRKALRREFLYFWGNLQFWRFNWIGSEFWLFSPTSSSVLSCTSTSPPCPSSEHTWLWHFSISFGAAPKIIILITGVYPPDRPLVAIGRAPDLQFSEGRPNPLFLCDTNDRAIFNIFWVVISEW